MSMKCYGQQGAGNLREESLETPTGGSMVLLFCKQMGQSAVQAQLPCKRLGKRATER